MPGKKNKPKRKTRKVRMEEKKKNNPQPHPEARLTMFPRATNLSDRAFLALLMLGDLICQAARNEHENQNLNNNNYIPDPDYDDK